MLEVNVDILEREMSKQAGLGDTTKWIAGKSLEIAVIYNKVHTAILNFALTPMGKRLVIWVIPEILDNIILPVIGTIPATAIALFLETSMGDSIYRGIIEILLTALSPDDLTKIAKLLEDGDPMEDVFKEILSHTEKVKNQIVAFFEGNLTEEHKQFLINAAKDKIHGAISKKTPSPTASKKNKFTKVI